ncbi:hypothetical protein ON05_030905 (plasmid) [Acaryochloris sp. CCMEE 5410]|nr:hypothetical protein ON05_030905 [Acaryochloris sp. CCMEE 5410]
MAYLNQIEIRESNTTYNNQRDWSFRTTAHHVCELMLHFLPRNYVLDGSAKFSAIFGPKLNDDLLHSTVLGVTSYCIEDFDVADYMTLAIEEQQEYILTVLTDAMMVAAKSIGNSSIIQRAADSIRANGYAAEIAVLKLSRFSRDRKLRVDVFRCLGPQIGETWEARISKPDFSLVAVDLITKSPAYLDRRTHFSKSQWSGNTFQIVNNRLQKVVYNLDISIFIRQGQ